MRNKHREGLAYEIHNLPRAVGMWLVKNESKGFNKVDYDPVFDVIEVHFPMALDGDDNVVITGILRHHLTRFHRDDYEDTMKQIKGELDKWAL